MGILNSVMNVVKRLRKAGKDKVKELNKHPHINLRTMEVVVIGIALVAAVTPIVSTCVQIIIYFALHAMGLV